jgi:LysM repeat protein
MRRISLATQMTIALALGSIQSFAADATSPQDEIHMLRLMVEKQSLQIDALTQQITKLNELIEGVPHAKATPTPSTPPPAAPAAPSVRTTGVAEAAPAGTQPHVVAKGETLTAIARKYNVTISELQQLNKIEDGRKLRAGQTLVIPSAKTEVAPEQKPETP